MENYTMYINQPRKFHGMYSKYKDIPEFDLDRLKFPAISYMWIKYFDFVRTKISIKYIIPTFCFR